MKSVAQRLIEEKLKKVQPEDGQEISEIDAARSMTEGELPTDSESKENEDLIIEVLDKKMQQYYEHSKDSIYNMVYDRNFLQIIREVVSNLNKNGDFVQPLKTEEELKEMGIDQASKAENAWKPSLGKLDEKEKKRKEIRGILNKITPSTFEDLKDEFIGLKLYEDESTLPMIVDLIFDKIVAKPQFVSLYSTLCKIQTEEEEKVQNSTRSFRLAIIKKCQMTFERTTNNSTEEAIESTQKEIDEEAKKEEKDEKKLKKLQEKLEVLQGKEKRHMFGAIRLISELYRHMLLTDNIIQWCVVYLIMQYQTSNDDLYIEYLVHLIEIVGPIYEKRKASTPVAQPQQLCQQTSLSLSKLLDQLDLLKWQVSTRIRVAIMDLIELKNNNWAPRHGNMGRKQKRFSRYM
uniref:MIF4G domain-containing protein n=1 Tax=Acrobeloides nanus TaxID=290746 RepID=A0A914CNY3_9BILA